MARYFRLPFAQNGDKNTLPDETANSAVSYSTGYTQDYQRDPRTDPLARRMERDFLNQLQFDITDTLRVYYETGVPPFITSAMNGGSAFSYPIRSRVLQGGRIYENTTADNTATPPGTGWILVDLSGSDSRYARRSNNLSDLANAGTARSNLELGTAATVDTGTSGSNVPTTTQADGRYARRSNNLSDLASSTTARTNLGLGAAATHNVGTAQGSLPRNSDLGTASLVDTGTASGNVPTVSQADGRYARRSNNLSDLASSTTARTNLGLGTSATRSTGTSDGNAVLIGDPSSSGNSSVVINTGTNANGRFRLWSDGYLEQEGYVDTASPTSNHTVTFPTQFTDGSEENLNIQVSHVRNTQNVTISLQSGQINGTSFNIRGSGNFSNLYWKATGF